MAEVGRRPNRPGMRKKREGAFDDVYSARCEWQTMSEFLELRKAGMVY